ncbi:MAG: AmmeMemoRadiSam system protein A [Bacilli bacterium]|nr:AmmeMemoRadiSam system protein A [Bacilli bacterium]
MPIVKSFIVPHPPLCIPEIGKGRDITAKETVSALKEVAREIALLKPDTIVFMSPHSEAYNDYFSIADGEVGSGSFASYGLPGLEYRLFYDRELVKEISLKAKMEDIPAGTMADNEQYMDHGTLVPLYFIYHEYRDFKAIRLALSGLSSLEHYRYGELLGEVFQKSEKRIVVIASGDLSHCQRIDGPYGYRIEGPRYDELMMKIIKSTNFGSLLSINHSTVAKARECGHRIILMLAGMFDRQKVSSKILSHEAPFGVGYMVASFEIEGFDASRAFYELYRSREEFSIKEQIERSDIYVRWARNAIETYIKTKKIPDMELTLPDSFLNTKAGVFVSLYEHGELRGCLGSVKPQKKNLGLEIAYNAIAAATHDPRFEAITPKDFPYLKIVVDVLTNPIPVLSMSDLDSSKYGVVVENGERRGVVLPGLAGVENASSQVEIARRKAGIEPHEDIVLYRFETTKHY